MEQMKTGTTILGIKCKDGVILASDYRMTMGYLRAGKMKKIIPLTDKISAAVAGSVSEAQQSTRYLQAELRLNQLKLKREMQVREAANFACSMLYSNIKYPTSYNFMYCALLIAGYDLHGGHLFAAQPDGSIQECDYYICDGSGMEFALSIIEAEWKKDITCAEAKHLAIKAVNAAISRDIASGDAISVFQFTKDGTKEVFYGQNDLEVK